MNILYYFNGISIIFLNKCLGPPHVYISLSAQTVLRVIVVAPYQSDSIVGATTATCKSVWALKLVIRRYEIGRTLKSIKIAESTLPQGAGVTILIPQQELLQILEKWIFTFFHYHQSSS